MGGPFDLRGLDGVLLAANRAALAVTVVGLVAAAVSLVGRFRHARGVERLQLRWVALAAVLVGLGAVGVLFSLAVGGSAAATLFTLAIGCCLVIPPVATGAAILRYRLYDLDRIISRTLAYGLLTLVLGGGYALVVLGLGQLLGRESPLVVAAATLAVAAVFQPARRRVQAGSIGGSTGDAMTRQGSSRGSVPACATRSTSTPSRLTCWEWSTRPCSRPQHRCGCGHPPEPPRIPICPSLAMTLVATEWRAAKDSNPQPPDP